MSKTLAQRTYYVAVEPQQPWIFSARDPAALAKDSQNECERISQEIRRHVDGAAYISIEVREESFKCEFCGSPWTEDGAFNLCCDDDMKNMPPEDSTE